MFQDRPFVDLLQNRCSWIIHKIHWETLMLELLFYKHLVLQNISSGCSWKFPPATLLKKRLRQRCFSVNFAKCLRTSFLLTEHLRMTASCVCLWILSFSEHFFYRSPPANCHFMYKLKNFSHHNYFTGPFKRFIKEREVAIWRSSFT